jgi:hypothetical protein
MPTVSGGETIGERLTRLRSDLARVRATIARHENNGSSWSMGGTAVTEIAYERAQAREKELAAEVRSLEARIAGGRSSTAALTHTSML